MEERIRIPVPQESVEVKPEGQIGRYFVMTDPEKAGWTWVQNVLGSDGATYEIEPDKVVITTHSTHDESQNGKKEEVLKQSRYYHELIEFYEKLLEIVEEQES